MNIVYTLNEVMLGWFREDKKSYDFFATQKAYDTVWCDGLWYKLWNMDVKSGFNQEKV